MNDTPSPRLSWAGLILVLLTAAAAATADADMSDASTKIDPQILANQRLKMKPAGVSAEAHAARLVEHGLNPANLDSEDCALYVRQRLTPREIAEMAERGVKINPYVWVPPVRGRHPLGYHLASVPYSSLETIRSDDRFLRLASVETRSEPHNNLGNEMIGVDHVHAGEGATARTGLGIGLAIADSGIDLTHPDFPVPVETFDVTVGDDPTTWSTDVSNTTSAHGTHVSGIAVGNGFLSAGHFGFNGLGPFVGSAPGASFHFYKTGGWFVNHIKAIQRAEEVGCQVFSLSYGGLSLYMDGSHAICQAIDSAVEGGVTVFTSAGNSATAANHASATVSPGSEAFASNFRVDNTGGSSPLVRSIPIWVRWIDRDASDSNIDLSIVNLDEGETLTEYSYGHSLRGTEAKTYVLTTNVPAGISKSYIPKLANTASVGSVPLVHLFTWNFEGPDPSHTIELAALCDGTIAVGAWTHRIAWIDWGGTEWYTTRIYDTLASYSSHGPRIDGRLKPEIVAPAALTIVPREEALDTIHDNIIDNDGQNLGWGPADYYLFEGTSAAAPKAAGVAALILEENPDLTPLEVRNILTYTASNSAAPDDEAGYGLINALAAVQDVWNPDRDGDDDGLPRTGSGTLDCDDRDAAVWSRASEPLDVRFLLKIHLLWSSPDEPGGTGALTYDVLRSSDPADFSGGWCLRAHSPQTVAQSEETPPPGTSWFFLVIPRNDCPEEYGDPGTTAFGAERIFKRCPGA